MGCGSSGQRVAPALAPAPGVVPPTEKRKVEVVLVNTTNDKENTDRCLKALSETCAQNQVNSYISFENAFNHIRRLDKTTTVILVCMGNSYKYLKNNMPDIDTFSNVRNCFIYSTESENAERPTETTIQYVFGKRHLLNAIRDTLEAIHASPVHKYSPQYISFSVHQSSINALLYAMKSVQFEVSLVVLTLTVKLSQMNVILSPSMFQFIATVELVNPPMGLSSFTIKQVHGHAELKFEKNRFFIAVTKFIVELTKNYGRPDISKWIPTFPLDGLINFGHPFDLPKACEAKRLILEVKNPKIYIEEKLIKLFIEINYTEVAEVNK